VTTRSRFRRRAYLALGGLATVFVSVLIAHEGHAPLPTRGVQVDVAKGHLLLTPSARDSLDVATAEVDVRAVEDRIFAYATITQPWTHHGFATPRLPGRISNVCVIPGQTVRADDVVAEVQSLELDTLQQNLLTARTEVALNEKIVGELRSLAGVGSVAGQTLIDAEAKLAQSVNTLTLARTKWHALGLPEAALDALLKDGSPVPSLALPVRAPVGGTVIHAELTVGRVVESTDHVAEVVDLSSVWVKVGILEKDIYRVKLGTPIEVRLIAYPGEVFPTTVTAVAPYLDPVTHVAAVWAELKNPAGKEPKFIPGMAGQADVILSADRSRPTVPVSAVAREGVDRFVLVEEANAAGASEYRRKPVALGRRANGRVEILAGQVFPGDRVVIRGTLELGGYFVPGVLRLPPETEREIGLTVEPATASVIDDVLTLDGSIDLPPTDRASAASPLAGTITAVRTDRGQKANPGTVLAEVYSPDLLALQLDLVRTGLELQLEEGTLGRIKTLDAVARRRVWETESRVAALRSQSETLKRKMLTVGLSTSQIEDVVKTGRVVTSLPVRSPVGGTVVTFDKTLGQSVAANEVLFAIHSPARPRVQAFVSERDVDRVQVGQPVRVRFVANPGEVFVGRVSRGSGMFGTESRAQSVWVDLTGPLTTAVHAQLARVTVVTGSRPASVTVPVAAVSDGDGSAVVFVRRPDGVFERRAVVTGRADDRRVEIVRGLAVGEPVAVTGVAELATGFASLR
jgi:RND family efflux transporter MFP subunit